MTVEGLEPRKEHDQRRINAIHQAVNRYMDAGLPIPKEWWDEYNQLVYRADEQSVFSHPVHDVERPASVWYRPSEENAKPGFVTLHDIPTIGDTGVVDYEKAVTQLRSYLEEPKFHETSKDIMHYSEDQNWIPVCGIVMDDISITTTKEDVNCFQCKDWMAKNENLA